MEGDLNGFMVCKECNDYYELQRGESPGDFGECQCGGNLKYVEYLSIEADSKKEFWQSLISGVSIGIILFFAFKIVIASLIGGAITAYSLGRSYKDGAKNGFITGALIMLLFMVMALIFGIFTRKPSFEFSIIFTYGFELVILFSVGLILLAGAIAALGGLIGIKVRLIRDKYSNEN